ncbi:MAG: CPBP family intramembrane metalloprotease [Microlunatus sp.]|nr:CPBP family intramembrane metalloprotease [Microlunatus sp.]
MDTGAYVIESSPPGRLQVGVGTPRWLRPAWVRLLILLPVFFLLDGVMQTAFGVVTRSWPASLLAGLVAGCVAVVIYRWAIKIIERRPAAELAAADLAGVGAGFATGAGLLSVVVLVLFLAGRVTITAGGSVPGAVSLFGIMAGVAVVEEIIFRGVLFRLVEDLAGTWVALAVSAVVFGGLHLANPHATMLGAAAIAIEAGMMLGAAYASSRRLWLPIGIHFGWNFAESGVFSAIVSGNDQFRPGLWRTAVSGPELITGGSFGPEASVISVVVCLIAAVFLLRTARRRGRIFGRAGRAVVRAE